MSQKSLRRFLRQKGATRDKELWITNSVAAILPVLLLIELDNFSGIESITPDYTVYGPLITQGTASLPEWNISAVNAPDLWDFGFAGAGIVVANMDTGVDLLHQDLQAGWRGGTNSWFNPYADNCVPCTSLNRIICPVRIECRACDLNASEPCDLFGHGTGTMGVMAGGDAGGTYIGVAPAAEWISAKIFADPITSIPNAQPEATASAIHEAFQWILDPDGNPATDDAPDVVNASWGIDGPNTCNTLFQADIQALKTSGIAVVFSAGNDGPNAATSSSPANYPESFSAGAVDENNTIAYFSSRGPNACDGSIFPDVVAPGVNIKLAGLTFGGVIPASYSFGDGTSFAAPHVAGVMALLMSAVPQAAISQMEDALKQAALDLGSAGPDNIYGSGLVDALSAYNLLAVQPEAPSLILPAGFTATTTPSYLWTVGASAGATQYRLYVSRTGGVVRDETFDATAICTGPAATDTCAVPTTAPLVSDTTYYWNVRGSNVAGYGPWAGAKLFTVTTATIPGAATPGLPAGLTVTTMPSYLWTVGASAGATQYRLYVSSSGGVVRDETFDATAICTGAAAPDTCTVPTTIPLLSATTYYWNVRGFNVAGYGPWAGAKLFTVTTATIPGAATPGLPAGLTATTMPSYQWTVGASAGAAQYRLYVSSSGGVVRDETFDATEICTGSAAPDTCTVPTTIPLLSGTAYYWNVRGSNVAGYGPWARAVRFNLL